jgi:signal transduction histidine kinase
VTVRLVATPDQVRLVVRDDGRGFDVSRVRDSRHGIIGMRERAGTIGGSIEVESGPDEGTRVEISVPLGGGQGG